LLFSTTCSELVNIGGQCRTRTCDLLLVRQAPANSSCVNIFIKSLLSCDSQPTMPRMTNPEKLPKLLKFNTKGSTQVAQSRFNFTKQQLNHLPSPTNGQRAYYYDSRGPRGLGIAVSTGGRKTFILYRKINGRPERISLGLYPDLSIELARKKAAELNGIIAKGENPAAQKREVRDEMTLKELFCQFGKHHASEKRTWPEMQREFDVYLHLGIFERFPLSVEWTFLLSRAA
jgi:Arm DNA-binding domain